MEDKGMEKLMKLFEPFGVTDLEVPEEFKDYVPQKEDFCEWEGGEQ